MSLDGDGGNGKITQGGFCTCEIVGKVFSLEARVANLERDLTAVAAKVDATVERFDRTAQAYLAEQRRILLRMAEHCDESAATVREMRELVRQSRELKPARKRAKKEQ